METSAEADVRLLKWLVHNHVMTIDQAKSYFRAFKIVKRENPNASITNWLISRKVVTQAQLKQSVPAPTRFREPTQKQLIESEESVDDETYVADVMSLAESLALEPEERTRRMAKAQTMKFGPYFVRSEIARGGMGAVYEVAHPELGGPLALKVLLARNKASERQLKRFKREVETIQRLDHPGIIKILDAGQIDGVEYLTMEYVDGLALDELFIEQEVSLEQLVDLLAKMAEALDHAHGHGVIHRDLKPANILIREDENGENWDPIITDFGLAKDLFDDASLSMSGTVIGTPRYLSPEQVMAQHDKIGPTTDIYALGVILYEGLTGIRPFDADSMEDLYCKIEDEPPRDPRDLNPDASPFLTRVCLKALEKRQEDRYQRGNDLARDLRRYLSTTESDLTDLDQPEPVLAKLQEQVTELATRDPKLTLIVIAFLGALSLFILAFAFSGSGEDSTTVDIEFDMVDSPFKRQ